MKGKPITILFVEDDASHAKLVRRVLEDHRIANQVFQVSDGVAAMDYLYRRGQFSNADEYPKPDLLLLDLRLPKMDGLEVLKKIKTDNKLKKTPVVILTTSDSELDIARAYELHANSYLVKPIEFDAFSELIRDLGFYWLAWNKSPDQYE